MSIKCSLCGRFMSYKDMDSAVIWSYYPNNICQEWAHHECWGKASERFKALVREATHYKPCQAALRTEKDDE